MAGIAQSTANRIDAPDPCVRRAGGWRQSAPLVLLLSSTVVLAGCTPPPAFMGLVGVAVVAIPVAILALVLWLFGVNARPLVSALVYLVSLIGPLVGVLSYDRMRHKTRDSPTRNDYFAALIASLIGGLTFAVLFTAGELVLGSHGLVATVWWGLGMFLYLFTLLLGSFYVSNQADLVRDEITDHVASAQLRDHLSRRIWNLHRYQTYQYLSFLVSPPIVGVLYLRGYVPAGDVLYWQFAAATFVIVACILATTVFVGATLGQSRDIHGFALSSDEIKAWYKAEYDCRLLYFVDIVHSLLIATVYTLAILVAVSLPALQTMSPGQVIAAPCVLIIFFVFFVGLPFYLGQLHSARSCARALAALIPTAGERKTPEEWQKALLKLRPLVPSSVPLKYLLVAGSAGGLSIVVLGKAFEILFLKP